MTKRVWVSFLFLLLTPSCGYDFGLKPMVDGGNAIDAGSEAGAQIGLVDTAPGLLDSGAGSTGIDSRGSVDASQPGGYDVSLNAGPDVPELADIPLTPDTSPDLSAGGIDAAGGTVGTGGVSGVGGRGGASGIDGGTPSGGAGGSDVPIATGGSGGAATGGVGSGGAMATGGVGSGGAMATGGVGSGGAMATGGVGSGGMTATGGSACGNAASTCKTAPPGWNGPVVLVSAASPTAPSCPALAPSSVLTAHSGLAAPAAQCGCSCGTPTKGQLSCSNVTLGYAGDCFTPPTILATLSSSLDCAMLTSSLPTTMVAWLVGAKFGATGSCTFQPSKTIPAVSWSTMRSACALPESCSGSGKCVPPLNGGQQLCVYVAGNATCPSDYPNPLTASTGYEDTRGCTACTCGPITGSCSGSITLQNDGCAGYAAPIATLNLGCQAVQSGIDPGYNSVRALDVIADGGCTANPTTSTGTATETGMQTICCAI